VRDTPGFAGHWLLDETSGAVALVRGPLAPAAEGVYHSGVNLGGPGAMVGTTLYATAPVFDGARGYVDVACDARLDPPGNLSFSVELWVKPGLAV
jgi:hypothetical protein